MNNAVHLSMSTSSMINLPDLIANVKIDELMSPSRLNNEEIVVFARVNVVLTTSSNFSFVNDASQSILARV